MELQGERPESRILKKEHRGAGIALQRGKGPHGGPQASTAPQGRNGGAVAPPSTHSMPASAPDDMRLGSACADPDGQRSDIGTKLPLELTPRGNARQLSLSDAFHQDHAASTTRTI